MRLVCAQASAQVNEIKLVRLAACNIIHPQSDHDRLSLGAAKKYTLWRYRIFGGWRLSPFPVQIAWYTWPPISETLPMHGTSIKPRRVLGLAWSFSSARTVTQMLEWSHGHALFASSAGNLHLRWQIVLNILFFERRIVWVFCWILSVQRSANFNRPWATPFWRFWNKRTDHFVKNTYRTDCFFTANENCLRALTVDHMHSRHVSICTAAICQCGDLHTCGALPPGSHLCTSAAMAVAILERKGIRISIGIR